MILNWTDTREKLPDDSGWYICWICITKGFIGETEKWESIEYAKSLWFDASQGVWSDDDAFYQAYLDHINTKETIHVSHWSQCRKDRTITEKDKIAYICDGRASCSLRPGCFLREDPVGKSDMLCRHTLDPEHAVNGICVHPENHPERFTAFPEFVPIRYYERLPTEEL